MKTATLLICVGTAFSAIAVKHPSPPAYSDAASATEAHPDFSLVGEYVSTDGETALQASQLKDRMFLVALYQGGLPGDGWDLSPLESRKVTADELKGLLANYHKVERQSPTLGKPAPAHALLTLPDGFTNVKDGILRAGGKTTKDVGSFRMHLEFLLPFKPGRNPSNQDRGNSGIYIFDNYEIQILDTFALDLVQENNAIKLESSNKQWCGALYKMKLPDVPMSYPPLRWQTYDIHFKAPIFDGGKKTKNARITVRHNGVLIHDDVELKTGTGGGARKKQLAKGPVFFQNHGNPVQFRNVWATEF